MASPVNPRPSLVTGTIAALLTGVCFYFGTGLHPQWWLTWLAAIPALLFAYHASAKWAFLVSFAGFSLGGLNQWGYFQILELPAVIRMEAFLAPALLFACAVMLSRAFFLRGSRWLAVLSVPGLWVSFEYILSFGPNGTSMSLGYSQMNFLPVLQISSITGIWGISFVVLFFASSIAITVSARGNTTRFTASSLAIVVAVLAFGTARLAMTPDGERVKIGFAATDRKPLLAKNEADSAGIVQAYVEAIDQLAAQGAQVVVIPEKIGSTTSDTAGPTLNAFSQAAANSHVTVVVGLDHLDSPLKHNLSYVFNPEGKLETLYEKHYMVPHWEDGYERGNSIAILPAPHRQWATAICKDMDFPTLSRQYAQHGAQLMFVPAWDFTVDDWLHGRMAILRGVESGFAIARSAKQGLMTLTDNRGRVLAEKHSSPGMATLLGEITLSKSETLYAQFGNWFAWLSLAITALLLLISIVRAVRRSKSATARGL